MFNIAVVENLKEEILEVGIYTCGHAQKWSSGVI
jgi:hypothetical protein